MIFVTIIVCAYNRKELLALCLNDFAKQFPQFSDVAELIVVDNNSTDGTREYVASLMSQFSWLRYELETQQGLSHARNRGALSARGQYLCYIDDDGRPSETYLERLITLLKDSRPDFLGGPVYPYYTTPKPAWFQDAFEIRKHAHVSGYSLTCSVSGSNYTIAKSVLFDLGLFSPSYGMVGNKTRLGEERDVLNRYRATRPQESQTVYYDLSLVVFHHVPKYKMKIFYFVKRGFFAGMANARLKNEPIRRIPWFMRCFCHYFVLDFIVMLIFGSRKADHPLLALNRSMLMLGKITYILSNSCARLVGCGR